MLGASILGGVGFTMAIVVNLAYTGEMHIIREAGHSGGPLASLAGVLGFVFLLLQAKAAQKRGVAYVSASSDDVARQTAGSEVARESEELLRGIEDHPAIRTSSGGEEARRRVRDRRGSRADRSLGGELHRGRCAKQCGAGGAC